MDLIVRCLLLLHVFIIDARLTIAQDVDRVKYFNSGHCMLMKGSIRSTFLIKGNCKSLYMESVSIAEPSQELFDRIADGLNSLSVVRCTVDLVYLPQNLTTFEFTGTFGSTTQIIVDEDGTFELEKITLDTLPQFPANLDKLRSLKVFRCYIIRAGNINLSVFAEMAQLEEVILIGSAANVTLSDLLELPSLRKLVIYESVIRFTNDSSCVFHNLETLALRNNSLGEMPKYFGTFTNLTHFSVTRNEFQRVALDDFANLQQLEHLNLAENDISEITAENRLEFPRLKYLSLTKNKLSVLNTTLWIMPALEQLSLGHNRLKQVDGLSALFTTGKRYSFDMLENPLDCRWLKETYEVYAHKLVIDSKLWIEAYLDSVNCRSFESNLTSVDQRNA